MDAQAIRRLIAEGRCAVGIEFGSTRIKAVLIDDAHECVASGSHDWENRLENGIWTYGLEDVWGGFQHCYAELKRDVREKYGLALKRPAAIGISAMMHGYLAFDRDGGQLAQFRTWRNTTTGRAAAELTKLFDFNIPLRWSIAHLYQAMLDGEEHVGRIAYLTTLAGYVHWKLTGERVLSVGDASGMFPIDSHTGTYSAPMTAQFDELAKKGGYAWRLGDILPAVLPAGAEAGRLTPAGAKLMDPEGDLEAGVPLCPPEGDAGTGMVATNSVRPRTGNVSAGTSVFAMIVLEKELSKLHTQIDMVATPAGMPVAMAHCNSCTSDLNAWVGLFAEFCKAMGFDADMGKLFGTLYRKALEGDADCGGLMAFNYFAGEPVTGLDEGRPMFLRTPDASFTLANFMRAHLYAALATLKLGMDVLLVDEGVKLDRILGHGGLFKTPVVGQRMMAAAIDTPVSVMETAGEGGAWGIALLASYMVNRAGGETLEDFLDRRVFSGMNSVTLNPDPKDVAGFGAFLKKYVACLSAEKAAVESLR